MQRGVEIWVQSYAEIAEVFTDRRRTGAVALLEADSFQHGLGRVPVVDGIGRAVWEVAEADRGLRETVSLAIAVIYKTNVTESLPTLGASTLAASLGSLSGTPFAAPAPTGPIPRLLEATTARPFLTVQACRTNILFPFVSNQAGLDTGLVIANTSMDPFGTPIHTGACSLNFHGDIGGVQEHQLRRSPIVAGGEHFAWTLSSGGLVSASPGFHPCP